MKKPHTIFFAQQKQRKILLACGLSIRQLPALGCWNVTLLLLWLLLQKKCEYHRTCCDYLVVVACQDCSAWNERKKTPTFLLAGRKYVLRFVKKLCTHVQVLGVVAMVKNERQGCNVSYCWQDLLLSSVELSISIDMYCWEAAKRSQAAITELLLFCKSTGVILRDALPALQRLCANGPFEDYQEWMFVNQRALPSVNVCEAGLIAKCECLWSSWTGSSSSYLLLKI